MASQQNMVVKSFLASGDGFVLVDEFDGEILNLINIDGYIELTIGGMALLTRIEFDYVDQLWAYICRGLGQLATGNDFRTHLPDQDVGLDFLLTEDRQFVRVVVDDDIRRSAQVGLDEFLDVMIASAKAFFATMIILVPENRLAYEDCLAKLPDQR